MLHDDDNQVRAATYRENATALRRIAYSLRFDLCRQKQLRALAEGFDRLAERAGGAGMKEAAD